MYGNPLEVLVILALIVLICIAVNKARYLAAMLLMGLTTGLLYFSDLIVRS